MTVIAYRDGVLAADTQLTGPEGLIAGALQKLWRRADGAVMGCCGAAGDCVAFGGWFCADDDAAAPVAVEPDEFAALVVTPDRVVIAFDGRGRSYSVAAPFYARGAGADLAIGAMAAGADAVRAVEIACRYSIWCGGQVQRVEVLDPEAGAVRVAAGRDALASRLVPRYAT